MIYYEIHKLSREGHSIAYIARYLVLNWRTVKKYLSMTEKEYEVFLDRSSRRERILSGYEGFVLDKLRQYPDTSAAQMHDWLKENHPDFPKVSAKTVFNFVIRVRQKYQIPKTRLKRQFSMVEELPYGKQAQVDFGEYNMRTSLGKRKKVYFFCMVLSRSRYKYLWFTDRPFTSSLAIQAHEHSFDYFNGIAEVVVYDQDKVFIVSENGGDIILTDEFKNYTRQRSFNLHFCRKSDPQSKGKIENVVKFIKQNFLYNRTYFNLDTLNDEAMNWLGRTGNSIPHGTTGKTPFDEMSIEQPFLIPYFPIALQPEQSTYAVRKDNTISYKGNFYSLPLGTFAGKGTSVGVQVDGAALIITDTNSDREICRHPLSTGKGQKVLNTDHKRDKSTPITLMIDELVHLFPEPHRARKWLENIRADKPRYIRDQLIIIREAVSHRDPPMVARAVEYCVNHNIYSAADFKDVLDLQDHQVSVKEHTNEINPLSGHRNHQVDIEPDKSNIDDYQSIF